MKYILTVITLILWGCSQYEDPAVTQRGPKGDQGYRGLKGERGPEGPRGSDGMNGADAIVGKPTLIVFGNTSNCYRIENNNYSTDYWVGTVRPNSEKGKKFKLYRDKYCEVEETSSFESPTSFFLFGTPLFLSFTGKGFQRKLEIYEFNIPVMR